MTDKAVVWGVIGCGGIAESRFVPGITAARGNVLSAVASRSPGKAEDFARRNGIHGYYQSYEELLSRKEIDAVYIATTHNFHYENVKLALEYGKHVLCEKSFTVNADEARKLIRMARERKLFLMEGMWTRFLPAIIQLREWIKTGRIGEVLQVRANFGFSIDVSPRHRLLNPDLAGGALLDAGIYPLSFASMVMEDKPQFIHAVGEKGSTGVDIHSAYLLKYPKNKIALLSSAVGVDLNNRADILGTKGHITVPAPFHRACRVELYAANEDPLVQEFPPVAQDGFKYEIEAASSAIRSGETESAVMPLDETLLIMSTIDTIKKQLGLVYKNDHLT